MERGERIGRWVEAVISAELANIEALPKNIRIGKAGSGFWQAIYRIAGLVNAGLLDVDQTLNKIKFAVRHTNTRGRDIDYQWKKALKKAPARMPK